MGAEPAYISIHVLRVEDNQEYGILTVGGKISIHVLRVEDNQAKTHGAAPARYFNPRPPCGGQLCVICLINTGRVFQSTSSVWRTTALAVLVAVWAVISIHVLRVEDNLGTIYI